MGLLTESELRTEARSERMAKRVTTAKILREERFSPKGAYDIFLCHSKMDEDLVHGAKRLLEKDRLSVYVDWIDDPLLDRASVTPKTANMLRNRMRISQMLVYAHTVNSAVSRWCPWELGYFDGMRGGNVFLLPIVLGNESDFTGQEYIGLYPYLDKFGSTIFINKSLEGARALREATIRTFSAR